MMKSKHWYDYLWLWPILYFTLGFFNILFAWLGMIDFMVPLLIALIRGDKIFCNRYCGRGQLLGKIGGELQCSRYAASPRWLSAKWFRRSFLAFFLLMFASIIFQTYSVAAGAKNLQETVQLLWLFNLPWDWAYSAGTAAAWSAQFSFGFYSLMLTSTLLGLAAMALYKPRSWCTFCPMGTMTQEICRMKAPKSPK